MQTDAARRLWQAIEPLHAAVYFAPETAAAAKDVGLKGYWMGYFAGRAAPLGPVGPEPVTATFFGFAPWMVARALPDAWGFARPDQVLSTRVAAVVSVLQPFLDKAEAEELASLLEAAVGGCSFDGRPLAAAWSSVDVDGAGGGPVAAAWLGTSVLREHRGDGHVAAAVGLGLTGLETSITHVASGALSRQVWQPTRGWTDEEWDSAAARLATRGVLDGDGRLTAAGKALRAGLEESTDRLAMGPVEALGPDGVERVVALAGGVSQKLTEAGVVPAVTPIGTGTAR
ncbi:MAG TPA: hypothetical protein VGO92_01565 [Acidimicrobiales bacterium]|jgi:hypothetical protein|nr:hypothetical protein [Acidimicrobiales bacterium]